MGEQFFYMLGFVAGLIFVAIVMIIRGKADAREKRCKYDERQLLIRANGYRLGFFTLMFYNAIYGCLLASEKLQMLEPYHGCIVGIFLAVLVFGIYCITKDAYLSFNERPKRYLICFGIVAAVGLISGINAQIGDYLFSEGKASWHFIQLVCGVVFLVLFLVLLGKTMLAKKGEAE